MICGYALGGEVEDPEAVVEAFEVVLADYLEHLYLLPPEQTADRRTDRSAQALARPRATVDRVISAHRPGRPGDRGDPIERFVLRAADDIRMLVSQRAAWSPAPVPPRLPRAVPTPHRGYGASSRRVST